MAGAGRREHRIVLKVQSAPVPDGHGGYWYDWIPLTPAEVDAEIRLVAARPLERPEAHTVLATTTAIVTIDFHPEVTTRTRIWWERGAFNVVGVRDVDLRGITHELTCEVVVP